MTLFNPGYKYNAYNTVLSHLRRFKKEKKRLEKPTFTLNILLAS